MQTAQIVRPLGYQPALDGLRGLAVLQVLLFHGRVDGFRTGIVGVGVFFVLSGFLITTLIMTEIGNTGRFSLRNFYIRRVRRLLPAYVLALAFCSIALFFVPGWGTLRGALASVFYFTNWMLVLNPDKGLGMLHHTWTLSIEEQFYLFWPALLLWIASRRPGLAPQLAGRAAGALILILVFGIVVTLRREPSPQGENLLASLGGFEMLICGALLALIRLKGTLQMPSAPQPMADIAALVALIALAIVSAADPKSLSLQAAWLTIIVSTSLLIIISIHSTGLVRWCLTRPALVGVGMISYGLYLWHFPIFYLVDVHLGLDHWWSVVLASLLSFCVSIASYVFVETSFRRGSHGRLSAPQAGSLQRSP